MVFLLPGFDRFSRCDLCAYQSSRLPPADPPLPSGLHRDPVGLMGNMETGGPTSQRFSGGGGCVSGLSHRLYATMTVSTSSRLLPQTHRLSQAAVNKSLLLFAQRWVQTADRPLYSAPLKQVGEPLHKVYFVFPLKHSPAASSHSLHQMGINPRQKIVLYF